MGWFWQKKKKKKKKEVPDEDYPGWDYTHLNAWWIDRATQEIDSIENEVRTLNRQVSPNMILATTVVSLVANLVTGEGQDVALLLAPLLLGAIAAYQLNVACEVAAMAEQRDRLAAVVNAARPPAVFLRRPISDIRRGSVGTVGAYATAGAVILLTMISGVVNAASSTDWRLWVLQGVVTAVAVGSIALAGLDFYRTRKDVHRALDRLGLPSLSEAQGAYDNRERP